MTDETKKKISVALKRSWRTASKKRREISRQSMLKNAIPVSQTESVKIKRVQTRKDNGWLGHTEKWRRSVRLAAKNRVLTDETRKQMSISAKKRGYCRDVEWKPSNETLSKMSVATTKLWKNGVFKFVSTSKGQNELYKKIKELHPDAILNHIVNSRPFDVFIPSKNLLVEFNGTYWHYDPRKFDENYFDKSKNRYAKDIWKADTEKVNMAKSLGYNVKMVWQLDWETKNKQDMIEELLK